MLEGAQDQQGGQDIPSAVALMKLRPKAEDWLGYRMVIQHWDLTISQCAEKSMKAGASKNRPHIIALLDFNAPNARDALKLARIATVEVALSTCHCMVRSPL